MLCQGEGLPRVHLLGQETPGEAFYHLLIMAGKKLQMESLHFNSQAPVVLLLRPGSCAGKKGQQEELRHGSCLH